MKVAYLIPGNDAIGPNIFTNNLVRGLLNLKDFECEIFHFSRNEKYTNTLNYPVKTTKLNFREKYDFSKFDIIHSTQIFADSYVFFHKLYKEKKCITSMHCFMYPDFYVRKGKVLGWIDVQLWKLSLNKIHNIIVSSSAQKYYYEKHLDNDHHFVVIPYGIPEMQTKPMDKAIKERINAFKKGRQLICGCGSLIRRKGFHQLIEYLQHNKEVGLVIIGEGSELQNLKNQANRLGVFNRILFLGFLEDSYIYYPLFDAYCMTSSSEGFGLAMLEAMCMGTPIICSNLDIYKDYFDNSNVGLFEYNNQDSLNMAIDKVLSNKDFYAKMSRKLYEDTFSVDKMAISHLKFYKGILNSCF